jgi:hydroxymethylpyrimidine pyrophosphatase-like HAD family hydrolase
MARPYRALAIDYDGTLTEGEQPERDVLDALERARRDGLVLVLATGRRMAELRQVFPAVDDAFDAVVAENGAVAVIGGVGRALAPSVSPELTAALREREVPIVSGEVLLACDAVHAATVLEEIQRLGLDEQLVRNREALMVLPAGVTKGTGVVAVLEELAVSPHDAVGVGDAENDHALLAACELGVAVANAVPGLRRHADLVLDAPNGQGLLQLLTGPVLRRGVRPATPHAWLHLGVYGDGTPARLAAAPANLLIAGGTGEGKSMAAGLLVEQLARAHYSVLVVDLEGDHTGLCSLPGISLVGGDDELPGPSRLLDRLARRPTSMVVDLSHDDDADAYLAALVGELGRRRAAHQGPHWVVIDEAQRALVHPGIAELLAADEGLCLVTWRPETLFDADLTVFDTVLAFADDERPEELVRLLQVVAGAGPDELGHLLDRLPAGHAVLGGAGAPRRLGTIQLARRATAHTRHRRKYATATLPEPLRFVFRRPGGEATGDIARNILEFHDQLGAVSDAVVAHHLLGGDFSAWARSSLQDPELATALAQIEEGWGAADPVGAERTEIRRQVARRYLSSR